MSQAASDIFLSWQRSEGLDGKEHDFYVRQLWDWKASADLSTMTESGLHAYTRACGWSLARAHARSGDRLAIAAYLGGGANFDRAIARFSTPTPIRTSSTISDWPTPSPRARSSPSPASDLCSRLTFCLRLTLARAGPTPAYICWLATATCSESGSSLSTEPNSLRKNR